MTQHPRVKSGSMAPIFGILGLFGMLVELKHGIPEICAPFANCTGLADFALAIKQMDDIVFVGILAWVAMLVLSMISIVLLCNASWKRSESWGKRSIQVKRN